MKKIKNFTKTWAIMLAVSGLFMSATACNNTGERAETDYVNEIEAEENAVGQPDGELDVTPGNADTQPDTTSQSETNPNTTNP